jgi:hypothetical protein
MAQKKQPGRNLSDDGEASPRTSSGAGETPFDLWLQRGLHQMFDNVAQEPIPEDLLRLIDQDRKKS